MKKIVLLFSIAILTASCNAQSPNEEMAQDHKSQSRKTPKGSWSINKEVDEHGNIIRYDSIYTWSSSSGDFKEFREVDPDSILQSMREHMQSSFGIMGGDPFAGFFENDSTRLDPFDQDFFRDPLSSFPNIDEIRQRMEAMQQQFLQREAQPLIPMVPEEERRKQKSAYAEKSI